MRNALLAVILTMCAGMVRAGESGRVFFPDLLPGNTIACIVPPDGARVERDYSGTIFARLAADAQKIACPIQETFYAKRYGELVDKYGVLWAIMYEQK